MWRGDDRANRVLQFAAAVLRLVGKMPTDHPSKDIARQLSRAATAAGHCDSDGLGSDGGGSVDVVNANAKSRA